MNIEKVKNYNQKLLASLGTVVLIIAILLLFLTAYFTYDEVFRSYNYDRGEEGILADEKIEQLQKENKRQQVISYDFVRLVDTINLIYMIPVSHKTLNEPERIDEKTLGLMASDSYYDLDYRYDYEHYGDYNNLLIYDLKNEDVKQLFQERINFQKFSTQYFEDDIFILFKASKNDTYKDGVINLKDYKSLFIYSLKEKELRQIYVDSTDLASYSFVENSKDLLIGFGIDKNKDGKFDDYNEPTILKKYDFETRQLTGIIDEKIDRDLQKMLEGTK